MARQGDHVTLTLDRPDYFPWQTVSRIRARVVSTPRGPGDLFVFDMIAPDSTEHRVELNPASGALIAISHDAP